MSVATLNSGKRLISPSGIVVIVIVVVATLIELFPRNRATQSLEEDAQPDALAIEYLKIRLQSEPDNRELRLLLARQLFAFGELEKAAELLPPLLASADAQDRLQASLVAVEILVRQIQAGQYGGAGAAAQLNSALERLRELGPLQVRPAPLRDTLLGLPTPALRARALSLLSDSFDEQQTARDWRILAAQNHLADQQYERAVTLYRAAFQHSGTGQEAADIAAAHVHVLLQAGQPQRAYREVAAYLKTFPQNPALLRLAIDIGRQNGQLQRASLWARSLRAQEPADHQLDLLLFEILVAGGDLVSAQEIADTWAASAQSLAPELQVRVAQLYGWNGEPEKALHQWLQLAEQARHARAAEEASGLAVSLQRHREQIRAYGLLARHRPLSDEELQRYLDALLAELGTGQAELALAAYIDRYPRHRHAWWLRRQLLVDTLQFDRATALDRQFALQFRPTVGETMDMARLQWELRQPEEALQLLQSPRGGGGDHLDHDYWSMVAEIAWVLDEIELAEQAYSRLLNSEAQLSAAATERALQLAQYRGDREQGLRLARQGWENHRNPRYLLAALQHSIALEHWDIADGLMHQAQGVDALRERSGFQLLAARHAQHHGMDTRALGYLEAAVHSEPDNPQALQALLWFLIDSGPRFGPQLERSLRTAGADAVAQRQLWHVMGAGWHSLQRYSEALHWYGLALPEKQSDWLWLSGYADALQQAGLYNDAYRVKQRILGMLQARLENTGGGGGEERQLRLRLLAELEGELLAWRELASVAPPDSPAPVDAAWLPLLLEWCIRDGRTLDAEILQARAHSGRIELPGWQQLSRALSQRERDALQQLVFSARQLPPADRVAALRALGLNGQALEFGLSQLGPHIGEATGQQLRQMVTGLRPELPNGARLRHGRRSIGELDLGESALRFARASGNAFLQLDLNRLTPRTDSRLLRDVFAPESDWQLHGESLHGAEKYWWRLTGSDRTAKNIHGFAAGSASIFDQRLSGNWQIGYGQRDAISASFYQLGYRSGVQGGLDYQLDRHNRGFGRLRWSDYRSFDGAALAQGYRLQLGWQHQLQFTDPDWSLHADLTWMDNRLEDRISERLHPYFTAIPSAATLVADEYCRIGIGSSWRRSRPGEITQTAPSPTTLPT
ncbi:tetratricopeptide repeat protein [Microbulbifer taiwanensis]|uniref:tetratricopeptide repeat protein n=1 Tax=Microbulbifer taiwanensis TaxID=986746 RepID=UPI00360A93E0